MGIHGSVGGALIVRAALDREAGDPTTRQFLRLMVATGVVVAMTSAIEVPYARRLGASPLVIAAYIAGPGLAILAVDLFGSRLVPRLDARVILAVGLVMFGAGEAGLGAAQSVGLLAPGRMLQGLGSGLVMGASLQAAIRVNPDRVRALGSFNGAYLLGLAIGAPLGGFTATLLPGLAGYRLGFFACFAASALLTLALVVLLPTLPAAESPGRARVSFPRIVGTPGIGPAMVLGTLGEFLRGAVVYTTIPLAGLARGYSPATIGVAIGLLAASEIATMRALTRVIERLGLTSSLVGTLAVGMLASASFMILQGQAAYLLGAGLFGVALAGATLAPALLIVSLHDDDPASGLASYRMACGTGLLVGAVGAGTVVAAAGPSEVFGAVTAILAASVALTQRLRRRLDDAQVAQSPDALARHAKSN